MPEISLNNKKKLKDLCHINKESLKSSTNIDYSFNYIDLASVNNGGIAKSIHLTFGEAPSRARRIVKKNNILMSTVRPYLKGFAIYDKDEDVVASTGFAVLEAKKGINTNYIYQYLFSRDIENQINRLLVGSNYPAINTSDVQNLVILLPSIQEQNKIADILSIWDQGIELKLLKQMEYTNLKKAIVQTLFSKTNTLKLQIKDLMFETKNKSNSTEEVFSVSVHKGLINQIEHLGRSYAANNTKNYNAVNHGDIVYTKSPTGDFPYGIIKRSSIEERVIVSPLYGVFKPKNNGISILLDTYFESPINTSNFLKPIIQKGAKNTINITNKTFLNAKINFPIGNILLTKYALLITEINMSIEYLENEIELLKQQKKGLMQRLLTGKVRVQV